MIKEAQKFIDCLEDAEQILEKYPSLSYSAIHETSSYKPPEHFNLALFEQWSDFCRPTPQQKPTVRIIQHLACTGGTLISKCLAAMPNVALLSEANPLSTMQVTSKPRFAPTDLTYLATLGSFPLINELAEKIFRADIDVISNHVKQLGKYLVIREHSHSDYLVGESPKENSTICKLLKDDFSILSVLTVRHPVDSYLSLRHNGWVTFTPDTLEEYCNRYLSFIEHNESIPLYKYENVVDDPYSELKRICEVLELPFNEDFQDVFDLNAFSGDSGRSSGFIEKRESRNFDDKFRIELKKCGKYLQLCERLNYESSIV